MSKTTKEIVFWLSALSSALGTITVTLAASPGDIVSNDLLVVLGAFSAGLAAMVAFATRQTP